MLMKHVGIFEAKTHLSSLVDEIERKGREVVITRHGKPVAKLVRVEERLTPEVVERRRKAPAKIREIANSLDIHVTRDEIKASIEEGRH
jgi:prevent-host-death family protein